MRWRIVRSWALAPIVAGLILAGSALAQVPAPPVDPAVSASVEQARTALRTVALGSHHGGLSDTDLRAALAEISPIEARLNDALGTLTPRLADTDARLAQLGPAPGAALPPETAETAAVRRGLVRTRQALDAEVKLARLLAVEAEQTSKTLIEQLHQNFAARLWSRSRSILDPGLWRDSLAAAPSDLSRLAAVIGEEARRLAEAARRPGGPILLGLALILGLAILGPARLLLNRLGYRRAAASVPGTRLRRSALALWLVVVAAGTPLAAGALSRALALAAGAVTPDFDEIGRLLILVIGFAGLLEGLGRAMLSPGRPSWRLAPIPDAVVARLAAYPGLIGLTAGLATLVAGVNTAVGASLATSVASDCVSVLLELGVVGATLLALGRARNARATASGAHDALLQGESRLPWVLAALAAWLALGAAIVAIACGYLALATFLMRETIWIGAVLAILFLALRLADDLFPTLLSPRNPVGRAVRGVIWLSDGALEQLAVLLSGLTRLALLVLGWTAILAPFGATGDDIVARIASTKVMLKLGQVSISPGAILGGIGLFLVGLAATRAVRGWLEARYLPKTSLDVGLRTSVAAAVSYLGVVLALLLAFAYLGLTVSQIALFASALSVGIGFGLQSIIGNFVSGLILLAERPIKVGDWIAIGELEGDVRAINIRATEIEMMDRSRLIVPNSDLVSKTVRNVTHTGALGRVRIVLRVDSNADPTEVRTLLMARLTGHPDVVAEPAAAVYLTDARDGGLEFTAFVYVESPRLAYRVRSELLFQIVPDLKAHGVALANSNAVVNVGLPDRPMEPAANLE